ERRDHPVGRPQRDDAPQLRGLLALDRGERSDAALALQAHHALVEAAGEDHRAMERSELAGRELRLERRVEVPVAVEDRQVLDGYGHVSARHDRDPSRYLMSRSLAPELVTAGDVLEYDLDSNPVDARARASYLERFIHGEIYKARPDVRSIVHNHSPSVIPFGVTGVPLRPLYHMSAFLWEGVPVFDIRQAAGGPSDMLVG